MPDLKALLEHADRAVSDVPLPSGGFEGLERRRDRRHRNRRITAGVVGLAVFFALALILGTVGLSDRTQAPAGGAETGRKETGPRETGPAEAVGPVPETDYVLDLDTGETMPLPESIATHRLNQYAVSPDGSRLAFSAPGDNGRNQIFVANLDGTDRAQVTNDLTDAFSPAWSPDGSKIAFIGRHGVDEPDNLFVLDLATGKSTQLTFATRDDVDPSAPEFGPWAASLPSFTSDGASIAYNAFRQDGRGGQEYWPFEKEIRIIPIAGGDSVRLTGGSDLISDRRLSPDGSLLSYDCGRYGSTFCIADSDGSDERVLSTLSGPGDGVWSADGTRIAYSEWRAQDVFIVDVATGEATYVAEGWGATWVDGHTLIVEIDRCYSQETGMWAAGGPCPG